MAHIVDGPQVSIAHSEHVINFSKVQALFHANNIYHLVNLMDKHVSLL